MLLTISELRKALQGQSQSQSQSQSQELEEVQVLLSLNLEQYTCILRQKIILTFITTKVFLKSPFQEYHG